MRNIAQRKEEERKLLYKVFTEDAKTDKERLIGYMDAQFIEKCLEIQRIQTLMGFGRKGHSKQAFYQTLDHMMDEELATRYDHGLMELTKIKLSDIRSAMYRFTFKFIKVKTEKLKEGKKAVRHTNTLSFSATDVEMARSELKRKLDKLGDTMIEELSVSKKIDMIITNEGDVHAAYTIEIEQ